MTKPDVDMEDLKARYLNRRVGPFYAWNPVSRTQVWQWCTAMGDNNPTYLKGDEVIAPPTMMQMWAFRDVHGNYAPGSTDEDVYEVLKRFDEAGYSATVAVNYDQTYFEYLKEGDHVHNYSSIVDISDRKSTGLGDGYFVTESAEYFQQDDRKFGEARVTYFKYQPPKRTAAAAPTKIERIKPVENYDSAHYWQGLRDGKLLIQVCVECETPRHPPQPMCENCQSLEWRTVTSQGTGEIHSYTVINYPEIPPFDYPNAIVLVDLDEGVRIAAQFEPARSEALSIGQRVEADLVEVQENLVVPVFKSVDA